MSASREDNRCRSLDVQAPRPTITTTAISQENKENKAFYTGISPLLPLPEKQTSKIRPYVIVLCPWPVACRTVIFHFSHLPSPPRAFFFAGLPLRYRVRQGAGAGEDFLEKPTEILSSFHLLPIYSFTSFLRISFLSFQQQDKLYFNLETLVLSL